MGVYFGGPYTDYSAMQGPCASGFHIPTKLEWQSLYDMGVTLGVWGTDTINVNLINYLHMPLGGLLGKNTSVSFRGRSVGLWSCDTYINDDNNAYYFYISTSLDGYGISIDSNTKSAGRGIRAFKDIPVIPDSSRTVTYQGTGNAGIYHNSTLGLISISSDGTNWITIEDKNLGATTVWNSGDTLSEANCGKYYQWGNNYGFPRGEGEITNTSSTIVNASSYGPGNYYSSSTRIIPSSFVSWESPNNKNLRGGETGVVQGAKELQNAYIGEYVVPYLCFTANTANSTVKLQKTGSPAAVTLETSTDGNNWNTYTFGNTITLSNIGDKVYWRNTSETDTRFGTSGSNYYNFVMTGSIAGSGDMTYLLNKNGTNTLSASCFSNLFENCTSLTTPPEIPATTLAQSCYISMFRNSGITITPELPAITLQGGCYSQMFRDCINLTALSKISATSMADIGCCANMFYGCTNLEMLPKLYTTALTDSCYSRMFQGCSKIELSTTQTGYYQTAYRIPANGTGSAVAYSLDNMFYQTGGSWSGEPSINTTYYTSNTVV